MDSALETDANKFFSLKEAAVTLSVPVEKLLEWNDNNILKPTITLNGQVGYTQDQIIKFLSIRQTLQNNTIEYKKGDSIPYSNPTQRNIQNPYLNTINPKSSKKRGLAMSLGISLLVFIPLTLLFFVWRYIPIPGSKPADSENKVVNNTVSQSSKTSVNFLESTAPVAQVPIKDEVSSVKDTGSTVLSFSDSKLATPFSIFEKDPATIAARLINQISFLPFLGQSGKTEGGDFNSAVNFVSRANCPDCFKNQEASVFDDSGNIKGETSNSDYLATTLGTTGTLQNSKPFIPTVNSSIFLIVLTLGILSAVFAIKKQSGYSSYKPGEIPSAPLPLENLQKQRFLEIDQKTDGTVVIYFNHEEYKLSKPELNSESDQFIERLLGFATENVKEIEYDILKDKKMRVNAPLSKLVTRLGFVGLKRDLFFPRTSKNRVLFRKYLTENDIASMGLTFDQISSQLSS